MKNYNNTSIDQSEKSVKIPTTTEKDLNLKDEKLTYCYNFFFFLKGLEKEIMKCHIS